MPQTSSSTVKILFFFSHDVSFYVFVSDHLVIRWELWDTEVVEVKEPSVSTLVMNFENEFDPYGAMSTPLYQTATFKQVRVRSDHTLPLMMQYD